MRGESILTLADAGFQETAESRSVYAKSQALTRRAPGRARCSLRHTCAHRRRRAAHEWFCRRLERWPTPTLALTVRASPGLGGIQIPEALDGGPHAPGPRRCLAAYVNHGTRRLEESRLADVMAGFLEVNGAHDEGAQFVVGAAGARQSLKVVLPSARRDRCESCRRR